MVKSFFQLGGVRLRRTLNRLKVTARRSLALPFLVSSFCLLPSALFAQATIYGYAATPVYVAPAGTLVQFQLTRPMNNYPIYLYQQTFTTSVTTNGYWIATNVESGIYNVIIGGNVNALQIDVPANTNTYNVLDVQQPPYLLLNAANYIPLLALSTNNAPAGYVATSTGSNWIAAPATGGGGAATNATLLNLYNGSATLVTANTTGPSNGISAVVSNNGTFTITMTNASSVSAAALAAQGVADTNYAITLGAAVTNFANTLGQAATNGYNLLGTAVTNWANATFETIAGANLQGTAITNWGNATFQPLNALLTTLSANAAADTVWGNATASAGSPSYTGNPVVTNLTALNSVSNAGNLTNVQTVFTAGITISNSTGLTNVGQTASTVAYWTGSPPHLASGGTYSGGTLGTVTSVSGDGVVNGGTITTSGSLSLVNAPANTVLANATGSAAAPSYVGTLDLTNLYANLVYASNTLALPYGTHNAVAYINGSGDLVSGGAYSGGTLGTVTSVAVAPDSAGVIASWSGSPITSSGTFTPTFSAPIQNLSGLANASGYLQNNGSGSLSWAAGTGGNYIANLNGLGTNTTFTNGLGFTNQNYSWTNGPTGQTNIEASYGLTNSYGTNGVQALISATESNLLSANGMTNTGTNSLGALNLTGVNPPIISGLLAGLTLEATNGLANTNNGGLGASNLFSLGGNGSVTGWSTVSSTNVNASAITATNSVTCNGAGNSGTAGFIGNGFGLTNLWDTNMFFTLSTNAWTTNQFHGTAAGGYTNIWLNTASNHVYWVSIPTNNAAYVFTNIQGLVAGQATDVDLHIQNTNSTGSAATFTLWWAQGTGAPPTGYISILNGFTNGIVITNSQGWYHFHWSIAGTNYMSNSCVEVSFPSI